MQDFLVTAGYVLFAVVALYVFGIYMLLLSHLIAPVGQAMEWLILFGDRGSPWRTYLTSIALVAIGVGGFIAAGYWPVVGNVAAMILLPGLGFAYMNGRTRGKEDMVPGSVKESVRMERIGVPR